MSNLPKSKPRGNIPSSEKYLGPLKPALNLLVWARGVMRSARLMGTTQALRRTMSSAWSTVRKWTR